MNIPIISKIPDFLSLGSVSTAISIFSVLLAIFFYLKSTKKAKPLAQIYNMRLIGPNTNELSDDVAIYFRNEKIKRMSKANIIFWNSGSDILDGSLLLKADPISFYFRPGDQILSIDISNIINKSNQFRLSSPEPHILTIEFEYLNPGDGINIELLHDSSIEHLESKGSIKGIPQGVKIIKQNRSSLEKLKKMMFLQQNPHHLIYLTLIIGLTFLTLGLLNVTNLFDIMNLFEIQQASLGATPFLMVGSGYTILPAFYLWRVRKRYPKKLTPDYIKSNSFNVLRK